MYVPNTPIGLSGSDKKATLSIGRNQAPPKTSNPGFHIPKTGLMSTTAGFFVINGLEFSEIEPVN